jgi:hypothetical protein
MKRLVNVITKEQWNCSNFDDVLTIDGEEFVKVHMNNPRDTVLINKRSLVEVITNESTYENKKQLNG